MGNQLTNSIPSASKPSKRADGWWYPYIFVVFMCIVVVVNVGMLTLAVGTFSGLETADYYRKGTSYNKTLNAVEAQKALGWSMSFDFPAVKTGDDLRGGTLSVTLTGRDGNPVTGASLRAGFVRPTSSGMDIKLPLVEKGAGLYQVDVALPAAGIWDLRLLAERGDDRYQEVDRIEVP